MQLLKLRSTAGALEIFLLISWCPMAVYCVAYIGKFNEPLYFYSKEEASETLHFQMILHSCLDIVEERKKRSSTAYIVIHLLLLN